jgi:hypothetical protein
MGMPAVQLAGQSLLSLMADADWLGQTVLQWLSRSPTPWVIDREVGDLKDDMLGGQEFLTYLRYNVLFDSSWIKDHLQVERAVEEVEKLRAMDQPENVTALEELGILAAAIQIEEEHFPAGFDVGA